MNNRIINLFKISFDSYIFGKLILNNFIFHSLALLHFSCMIAFIIYRFEFLTRLFADFNDPF